MIKLSHNEFKVILYYKSDALPFSMPRFLMPRLMHIYYACIGSKILWFARSASDINNFIPLSNNPLKRMHKGNKHGSILSMLNNIFFCLFYNSFLFVYRFACMEVMMFLILICFVSIYAFFMFLFVDIFYNNSVSLEDNIDVFEYNVLLFTISIIHLLVYAYIYLCT